jgi:hypothetical protein
MKPPPKYVEDYESEEEQIDGSPKKRHSTSRDLENLYDETSGRILQERNDYLLAQIRDFVQTKKWVNLRPEYQRRRRWDDKKQSKLIESLLMNVPVPPIFLYETELSRYEVMDGQQRLVSIIDFYGNKLELRGLKAWSALNGMTYRELPGRLKRGLAGKEVAQAVIPDCRAAASPESIIAIAGVMDSGLAGKSPRPGMTIIRPCRRFA